MNVPELIRRKRDGGRLSGREIQELLSGYGAGKIPDYQMAAWLMAVHFQGMSREETAALTMALMNSGRVFDLSRIAGPKVDKHSTGGVGDKVSLILAPLVGACGVVVPMVSGRSLAHTGGTLDKLEAIPGFRTDLSERRFRRVLEQVGVAMIGQTRELCPADKRLYALRDVTGTVDSIPLIAASIMAKKLAEGIDSLVLDVKTGTGAFMSKVAQARRLARVMIAIGTSLGKRVRALITGMGQPLGMAVGNSLEVIEAIEALKGRWPSDLKQVTMALAEEMLLLAGKARSRARARQLLVQAITSGRALKKLWQLIEAQGGNPQVIDDYRLLPRARFSEPVVAKTAGYVRAINALQVGLLGIELGIGRTSLDSQIDPGTGFLFPRKTGDRVSAGEVVAQVFAAQPAQAKDVAGRLAGCITYSARPVRPPKLIIARL